MAELRGVIPINNFLGITHQDNGDSVYFVANATDTLLRFGQWKPQPLAYQNCSGFSIYQNLKN